MVISYDHNHRFIVLATINTIVNYDHNTFIEQATGKDSCQWHHTLMLDKDGKIRQQTLQLKTMAFKLQLFFAELAKVMK
jgi:hypothetical protein